MSNEHTPGPYSTNYNAVGKTYRLIGAEGYGAIAEVFTESNAAMIATALNERDKLREQNAALVKALEFVRADQNSTVDYECGLLIDAALSRAARS